MTKPDPRQQRKIPRAHQKTARDSALPVLRPSGGRATIVAPCGSGKTYMASLICDDLAATGHARRRLILQPTLELLAQNMAAFRADSDHLGAVFAVCSPLEQLGDTPTTTSAAELAARLEGRDHYTVFATYASLTDSDGVTGAIIGAHRDQAIPAWDLVVCDEAHRTSGSLNKAWAAVHDDEKVPAARRLYLTATPRIWDTDPKYAEAMTPGEQGLYVAASMDDEEIYGPVVFSMQLSQAIAEGLASDYRIVLVAVDDPTLQPVLRRTRQATSDNPLALTSLAAATLKTCATYGVRRMISYHRRVADAQAFAQTLTDTADDLDGETADTPDGPVPLVPDELWARCVHMNSPDRYEHLDTFRADPPPEAGRFLRVLTNARLLGEGIDVVWVDGLCFAGPKGSVVDITQCLGRALRPHPDGGKATLLVPVYLAPGEDPDALVNADAYRPLYDILLALRAHDLRISDRLPVTLLGERTAPPAPQPPAAEDETAEDEGAGAETPVEPAELTVAPAPATPPMSGIPVPAAPLPEIVGVDGTVFTPRDIARIMHLRVMQPLGVTDEWMTGALDAMNFYDEYGHLAVTRATAAARSRDRHRVDLYTWLSNQRTARRRGELKDWQIHLLDVHGMQWQPRLAARDALITYAEECARDHGGLAVSSGHTAPDGFPLGDRLKNLRIRARGDDTPDVIAALAEIDEWWNPPWPLSWQRHLQQARLRRAQGVDVMQPGDTRTYRQWLRDPGDVTADQLDLLREIDLLPTTA